MNINSCLNGLCICIAAGAFNAAFAQSIVPQSVNSSGASFTQSVGSLGFTVGEIIVLTEPDSEGNTLGSGFAAGSSSTVLTINEPQSEIMEVKVFPNPTADLIHVKIIASTLDMVSLSIHSLKGDEVFRGTYAAITNTIAINTAPFAAGTYMLVLNNAQNQTIGTYKIIKH